MLNNILDELKFNFGDISEMKPKNAKKYKKINFNIDENIEKFNPKATEFYKNLMESLYEPEIFKKVLYEYNKIKYDKKKEALVFDNIIKSLDSLITNELRSTKLKTTDDEYTEYKINKKNNILNKLINNIDNITNNKYDNKIINKEINKNINDTFKGGDNDDDMDYSKDKILKDRRLEKIKNIDDTITDFDKRRFLDKFTKKYDKINENDKISSDVKINQYKDILNDIENDETISVKKLEVSKEDKIIFIAITFIIRLISLSLIEWSLNINMINNFTNAFVLYTFIYLILLFIIITITNLTYNYKFFSLYDDSNVALPSLLYYFYFTTEDYNTYLKILVHIGLILLLMVIPFIIKTEEYDKDLLFDYEQKSKLKKLLNNITLFIWLFTSIVAVKF